MTDQKKWTFDLTSENIEEGGVRLSALLRSLRETSVQHGFERFTPYGKAMDRNKAKGVAVRAIAVRGRRENWDLINAWLNWSSQPEGSGFWMKMHNSRRSNKTMPTYNLRIVYQAMNDLYNGLDEFDESLGSLTGAYVPSTGVTACCKAAYFYGWGNGDPERPDNPLTRADIHKQFKSKRGGLNTVNLTVIRQSQLDELGEKFLQSVGWYRVTETQNWNCHHDGVVVLVRNHEGTDPRVKTEDTKEGKKVRGEDS